ncbi:MAG: hypothetical protein CMI02_18665 [Oceanospirillaceae bacterium]|mgnify:FL=1|nr:hypothetical protein [Oceanospirillaceae bacterium]MBT14050.1 hypothetical protein [Oceanospirillaceae bacterium]|tara:strand:+ start:217007 stop:217753 length:747 start_codon:yes stop_codon:yes gene_type:complete
MRLPLFLTLLLLPFSLRAEDVSDPDPWEGFNRKVFAFNEVMDKYALKPVAQGYRSITPDPVEHSVSSFFSNLGDVMVIANDIGQLKLGQAASDTARFLVNTTVGFFGVFDVATHIGLKKHNEDIGQTLGYWGVGTGPYLVLPFLGPSNLRDTTGTATDYIYGVGISDVGDDAHRNAALYVLWGVNLRASLLDAEGLMSGDKYTFMRSAYQQRREFLVNDGETQDDFGDDDWGADWEEFDDDYDDGGDF